MDNRYTKLATPPVSALGAIQGGRNKGKSDINPQWKYEAMTEVYGLCGLGWKFAIDETNIIDLPNGEKMIFMKVALHIKERADIRIRRRFYRKERNRRVICR